MPFAKGKPRPANAGRKKGSQNKTTRAIKDAIRDAFDDLGGVPSLVQWGRKNPDAFYPLWARLAPSEVDVTSNGKEFFAPWVAAFGQPPETDDSAS